jgi:hypothetical protein
MNSPDWDRTRMDLHPADPLPEPGVSEPMVEEEVADPRLRRIRAVRIVNAIINFICGLFAVVLALHIVLVLGNANPANGFASFIDSWSSAVSLGLRNLFTPGSLKLRVLFNDGLAAIVWLVIGAVLTYLIRQFALPGPQTSVQYRRRTVR